MFTRLFGRRRQIVELTGFGPYFSYSHYTRTSATKEGALESPDLARLSEIVDSIPLCLVLVFGNIVSSFICIFIELSGEGPSLNMRVTVGSPAGGSC